LIHDFEFSVEATPLAIFPDIDHRMNFHPVAVEPSMQRPSNRKNNRQPQSQGFFSKFINAFFDSIVSTIIVTVTNVFTRKSLCDILNFFQFVKYQRPGTSSRTTTNTINFVIMGCTPSPLLYNVCPTPEITPGDYGEVEGRRRRPFVTYSTVTRTSTVTTLVVSSTVGLCAQLVNVTGPCRLRRGIWVDDPIVLSFDDEMEFIDETFSPSRTLR
jgi:hypothetical protein